MLVSFHVAEQCHGDHHLGTIYKLAREGKSIVTSIVGFLVYQIKFNRFLQPKSILTGYFETLKNNLLRTVIN